MQLGHYLEMLRVAEQDLAAGLRAVAGRHTGEPEVVRTAGLLAGWSDGHAEALAPFCARYAGATPEPPAELHADLFRGPREGGLGLLRDLHDVFLQASGADVLYTVIGQAAKANRDGDLDAALAACDAETGRTLLWLRSTLKTVAPQALVVS